MIALRRRRRGFVAPAGAHLPAAGSRRLPGIGWAVLAGLVVLAAIGYVVFALTRSSPEPAVVPVPVARVFGGPRLAIAWPNQGEAAVGVNGVGLIGVHGSGRPTPIASVAKIMSAYILLHDHPLRHGANGPDITVKPVDVAVYRGDKASGQSVVAVRAGERLSERQALQGLLLPSGNNIATLLAKWDAGSVGRFVARMNAQAQALGLSHTHYVDPSGVKPGTVSTASDQVRLAMLALKLRPFAQIVAMPEVTLPVAGRQFNVNALLGRDGVVGVKTGSTSRAGGCFVFAAQRTVRGRRVTVVGAVLHQLATRAQPSIIEGAFHASTRVLARMGHVLRVRVIRRGATAAWVKSAWADPIALHAARSVSVVGWRGLPIKTRVLAAPHTAVPLHAGQRVATEIITVGQHRARVPLVAAQALAKPSLVWRVTHP